MPTTELSKRLMLSLLLMACGGGGQVDGGSPNPDAGAEAVDSGSTTLDGGSGQGSVTDSGVDGPALDAGLSVEQRAAAAKATAEGHALCVAVKPFYWEIGDGSAALGSGSVNAAGSSTTYTATTTMLIASASKWVYSTYFVQKKNGLLTADDIKFFNFQSGYTKFLACGPTSTVDACLASGMNGTFDASTENTFAYGGGHLQKHASLNGLGAFNEAALATEMRSKIGTDIALIYTSPQLAGGISTSAAEYAKMLRKIITGDLLMKGQLGAHPVCASPNICPAAATGSPAPDDESWSYSIGHWLESDPVVGDFAFSSAGAFGFYPWVDASKTVYGILARKDSPGTGFDSVKCGRLIRKAWLAGVPVL